MASGLPASIAAATTGGTCRQAGPPMTDTEPTLLLTRPEPQSRAFLEQCEGRAGRTLPSVISPVLRIEPTGVSLDLDRFDTVIFTSANAARCLAQNVDLSGRRTVTVGARTAEEARKLGAHATSLGEDANSFVEAAGKIEGRVVLCRGVHARGDIAKRLAERGVLVEEAVIYDQIEQSLSPSAKSLLRGGAPVLVPLFSPRSAAILAKQAEAKAPLVVIAMSRNVAAEWRGPGRVLVAVSPTSDSMCDMVIEQFRNPSLGLEDRQS